MLRLAELQVLSQLAGSISLEREPGGDPLGEEGPEGGRQSGITMSLGTESLQRVQRPREQAPARWCNSFDTEIQRELFTIVTG